MLDLQPKTSPGLIGKTGANALAASVVQEKLESGQGVGTVFPQLMVGPPVPLTLMKNRKSVICLSVLTRIGETGPAAEGSFVELERLAAGRELATAFLLMMVSLLVKRQLM